MTFKTEHVMPGTVQDLTDTLKTSVDAEGNVSRDVAT